MTTHRYSCAVCGKNTYCSADEHVLGLTVDGCYGTEPKIEFCSIDCMLDLIARIHKYASQMIDHSDSDSQLIDL